jgi:hypothetical protein
MYNTIKDTKLLTRWAGETYEETQGDGVIIDDSAGPDNVFNYNNIYNNDDDGMENQSAFLVDAECNWWGHYSGPGGDGAGLGDAVKGNIYFDPWLILPAGSESEIEKAKIEFKKKANDDKAEVKGWLGVSDNCSLPVPSIEKGFHLRLKDMDHGTAIDFVIFLEKKGENGEKWEYKRPKDGNGSIKDMKIDWKNGKFDIHIDKADLSVLSSYTGGLFRIRIKHKSTIFIIKDIILTEKKADKWEY